MKKFVCFVSFFLCMYCLLQNFLLKTNASFNQSQITNDQLTTYQALLDLTFPYTIMCIAAHPDDEDSDSLAYFRAKYGARTVLVTATRGEGGQNSQGAELYEDLAILRAKETAAMAQRLDAIPVNLAMPDFGFSKSSEDTFKVWNRKEALRRLVFAIRAFKPDIIITVHDRKTGHGHHQATRLLAEEAYTLAADQFIYSEQLTGFNRLETWQVKRLFARTLSKTKFDVEFDSNQKAKAYDLAYSQIGYKSRLEHRSQGPWPQIDLKGERMIRFNLIKDSTEDFKKWYLPWQNLPETDLYKQIKEIIFEKEIDIEKVCKVEQKELLARLIKASNQVSEYLKETGKLNDYQAKLLLEKIQKAIINITKISVKITPKIEKTFPGDTFNVSLAVSNPTHLLAEIKSLSLTAPNNWEYEEKTKLNTSIEAGSSISQELAVKLSSDATTTLPNTAHIYDLDFLEPQINAVAKISLPELLEPILVIGKARVDVAPQIEVEINPNDKLVNITDKSETNSFPLQVKITNKLSNAISGRIKIGTVAPVQITPQEQQVKLEAQSTTVATFFVAVGRPVPEGLARFPISIFDDFGREILSDQLKMNLVQVRVANVDVGYLRSYDFTLPQTLNFYGVRNKELSITEIKEGNLRNNYDTVIIDNRAYLAYPELASVNEKLLTFVRNGGTLIVFYQRPSDWNGKNLSPHPMTLGDERVTDEKAPVTILAPEHPLMSIPNKITESDFDNWIQERGLSFPSEWDESYTPLLSCADPDEEQLKGGLLVAPFGRGKYIYTSYVIYRQLRACNPGAFHIFANMISLPKAK
jgi:LmbE family N-acetylglucosaminyl deacetylase